MSQEMSLSTRMLSVTAMPHSICVGSRSSAGGGGTGVGVPPVKRSRSCGTSGGSASVSFELKPCSAPSGSSSVRSRISQPWFAAAPPSMASTWAVTSHSR